MTPVEGSYPIGDLVQEMCDRLGLDPGRVARLDIEPTVLEATMHAYVYRTKVSLKKCRAPYEFLDPETGAPACHVFVFNVTTTT